MREHERNNSEELGVNVEKILTSMLENSKAGCGLDLTL
jgi:hypothetical protein